MSEQALLVHNCMVIQWVIVFGELVQKVPKSVCQLLVVAYARLVNESVAIYHLRGYPILTQDCLDFSLKFGSCLFRLYMAA